MIDKLLDIGNKIVKQAEKLGAEESEAYLYVENLTFVQYIGGIVATRGGTFKGAKASFYRLLEPWIKRKGIPVMKTGVKAGVGVRTVINKSVGFASVSSTEEQNTLKAVEEAINIAKIRPPDPNWRSLPDPKKPNGNSGVFDQKIVDADPAQLLSSSAECCISAADFDKRISQAMGLIQTAVIYNGIVNSRGIEVGDKGTAFAGGCGTKAKVGAEEVSSDESLFSRRSVEDLNEIGTSASRRTIECLGGKRLEEKLSSPVVFENNTFGELFGLMLSSSASALNVQEERSRYKGKIGELVADEDITIIDDGTLPEGFHTSLADDEGTPRQRTQVIEKGTLKSFLYDNYSAKREGRESTGNGSRRVWLGAAPFAVQPRVSPSNLVLESRKGSLQDLVAEVQDGILVKGSMMGVLHSNFVTGDFSVTATNAFRIKNGQIAYPLKPCSVGGNFYESLKSITAIGSDMECCGFIGNVICPSIIVGKLMVSA
jgi:PmbA protein